MCNCLREVDASFARQNENTCVDRIMFFDGSPHRARIASVKAELSVRKKPCAIVPAYCPFCGEKYPALKQDEEAPKP